MLTSQLIGDPSRIISRVSKKLSTAILGECDSGM
jgi:hypothetical protein